MSVGFGSSADAVGQCDEAHGAHWATPKACRMSIYPSNMPISAAKCKTSGFQQIMAKISTASMKKNRRPLRVFLTMGGGWAKKGLMGKFFALVVKIPHYMEC